MALDATADWVPQLWRDMDTTLAAAPLGDPGCAVMRRVKREERKFFGYKWP